MTSIARRQNALFSDHHHFRHAKSVAPSVEIPRTGFGSWAIDMPNPKPSKPRRIQQNRYGLRHLDVPVIDRMSHCVRLTRSTQEIPRVMAARELLGCWEVEGICTAQRKKQLKQVVLSRSSSITLRGERSVDDRADLEFVLSQVRPVFLMVSSASMTGIHSTNRRRDLERRRGQQPGSSDEIRDDKPASLSPAPGHLIASRIDTLARANNHKLKGRRATRFHA